ncbi:MAG: outer membrane lipoprotein carrier protein LolA [Acidobacteriota bacterium]
MRCLSLGTLFAVLLSAQPAPDASAILKGVEQRYNSTNTLQAKFTQTLKDRGRNRSPESGTVYINKSSHRTRWDYSVPAGDFFLSDGKYTYQYDKDKNTVERELFKETEDTRIPLSFLLGQLDFKKDFERYNATIEGANTAIALIPRNKKLAFSEITILVAPDFSIRRVKVTGAGSTMEYALDGEQRNAKIPDSTFKFTAPPGAKIIENN